MANSSCSTAGRRMLGCVCSCRMKVSKLGVRLQDDRWDFSQLICYVKTASVSIWVQEMKVLTFQAIIGGFIWLLVTTNLRDSDCVGIIHAANVSPTRPIRHCTVFRIRWAIAEYLVELYLFSFSLLWEILGSFCGGICCSGCCTRDLVN